MSDPVRTSFPTMGENPLEGSVVNLSGARSPYTQLVQKPGFAKSDAPDSSVPGRKTQTLVTSETNGPLCAPQTTLAFPNAPEAANTGRNLRIMPSKAGVSDFWSDRTGGTY